MLQAYDFIDAETLSYFKKRLTHAPRDASFALDYVLDHAVTREEQDACFEAVTFKCRMLWSLLDALEAHCFPGDVVAFPGGDSLAWSARFFRPQERERDMAERAQLAGIVVGARDDGAALQKSEDGFGGPCRIEALDVFGCEELAD